MVFSPLTSQKYNTQAQQNIIPHNTLLGTISKNHFNYCVCLHCNTYQTCLLSSYSSADSQNASRFLV